MKKLSPIIFFILFSCKADPFIISNEDYIISDNVEIIFCENNFNNNGEFSGCYIDDCIAINNNCYYEDDLDILSDFITLNDLSNFEILQLGNQLWSYGRLIGLNINNLQLINIPENIGDLITLLELNLSSNEIVSIPESIGNLIYLTKLDLNDNKLTSLPQTLCNIQCDCNINIDNNNLCDEYDFECIIDLNNQDCNE